MHLYFFKIIFVEDTTVLEDLSRKKWILFSFLLNRMWSAHQPSPRTLSLWKTIKNRGLLKLIVAVSLLFLIHTICIVFNTVNKQKTSFSIQSSLWIKFNGLSEISSSFFLSILLLIFYLFTTFSYIWTNPIVKRFHFQVKENLNASTILQFRDI